MDTSKIQLTLVDTYYGSGATLRIVHILMCLILTAAPEVGTSTVPIFPSTLMLMFNHEHSSLMSTGIFKSEA